MPGCPPTHARRGLAMKTCSKCNQDKPASAFHKCSRNPDGLYNHCKDCRTTYQRSKSGKMRQCQASIRKRTDDPTFTLNADDWELHWNATECVLCGKELPVGTHPDKQFDHKHGTNIYRGTLCRKCNFHLGIYEGMQNNQKVKDYLL